MWGLLKPKNLKPGLGRRCLLARQNTVGQETWLWRSRLHPSKAAALVDALESYAAGLLIGPSDRKLSML